MTFSELIGALFGWLGGFIEWVFGWVPRYEIIQFNERGVKYPRGKPPHEVKPGVRWFCPNLTSIETHHISRCVLPIDSLPLETADEPPLQVEVGMVLTYHIVDVLKYDVENYDADESMAEAAQGAMQNIVTSSKWDDLRGDTSEGTRLGNKLAGRMTKALDKFGVEVESARPTAQVRLSRAWRIFGLSHQYDVGGYDE